MHFGDVRDPQEIMQTPRKESLKAEKLCFFSICLNYVIILCHRDESSGVNKILSTPGFDAGPLKL